MMLLNYFRLVNIPIFFLKIWYTYISKIEGMWVASDKMKRRNQIGFTMIELLAVLVILGVIMVIAIPSVVSYLQDGKHRYYEELENSIRTGTRIF